MLCDSGIASMSELLDPEGAWTGELIELMLPVAIDREADKVQALFGANAAAVSLISGTKGAKAFTEGLQKSKATAKQMMRVARGLPPEPVVVQPGESAAERMMSVFERWGLKPRKRRRNAPRETRMH